MANSRRLYDFVLLGATGYTGRLCAEYITTHLPTNLRWVAAGRSEAKVQRVVDEINRLNPDRLQADVLTIQLEEYELSQLARKAKIILNCIGPYHKYSTPVVEACAENGTHYLDVTGETPWVHEIISKYHTTAQNNNTIIIPEIGIESTPSEIIAYTAVSTVHKTLGCGVRDITSAIHELKCSGPSGGTLTTVLELLDHYSLTEVRSAFSNPYVLSPTSPASKPSRGSLLSRILGTFSYPGLGILTTSISAAPNNAVVHRSAGLMPELYGSNFHYAEYMCASGYVTGILIHTFLAVGSLLLAISPIRTLAKKLVYQPGQGPPSSASSKDAFELRAIAIADQGFGKERRAMSRFRYDGGLYYFTGLCLAEAAMVLLREEELVERLGGGVLTPACLGDSFVRGLQNAGVEIGAEMMQ